MKDRIIHIKRCPSPEFVKINGMAFCKASVRRAVGKKQKLYTTFRLVPNPLGSIVIKPLSPVCVVVRLKGHFEQRWIPHNNFERKFYAGPLENETRFKLIRWTRERKRSEGFKKQ